MSSNPPTVKALFQDLSAQTWVFNAKMKCAVYQRASVLLFVADSVTGTP